MSGLVYDGFLDDLVKGWALAAGLMVIRCASGNGRYENRVSVSGNDLSVEFTGVGARLLNKWNLYPPTKPESRPSDLIEAAGALELRDQKLYCWFYSRVDPWEDRCGEVHVLADLANPDGLDGVVGRLLNYYEVACATS